MDKIEELVEWVAGEVASELLKFGHDYHRFEDFRRKVIVEGIINLPYPKKIAKQILSHPDLALLVKVGLQESKYTLHEKGIRTGYVIPLAEALKEVE